VFENKTLNGIIVPDFHYKSIRIQN